MGKIDGLKKKAKKAAASKLLAQFQKNYSKIKQAFIEHDLSEQRKFNRWLGIHQSFYSGAMQTISAEEKPFLLDAIKRFNRVHQAVRRKDLSEETVKQVVEDCDALAGLLDRSKNRAFWKRKLERNVQRDEENERKLKKQG